MNRRFRARGQAARVKATGQTKEVFEVSWLAKDDKAHRTRLMTAKRLFDELRNLGFKRVVFKVKGKVSFTKPLR